MDAVSEPKDPKKDSKAKPSRLLLKVFVATAARVLSNLILGILTRDGHDAEDDE